VIEVKILLNIATSHHPPQVPLIMCLPQRNRKVVAHGFVGDGQRAPYLPFGPTQTSHTRCYPSSRSSFSGMSMDGSMDRQEQDIHWSLSLKISRLAISIPPVMLQLFFSTFWLLCCAVMVSW